MKAMVLVRKGKLERQNIPAPKIVPEGVIVRVEAAALCNSTDLRILDAPAPSRVWPGERWPLVMGHEVCGTIVETGAKVGRWRAGDRIGGWCPPSGGFAQYCLMLPGQMAAVLIPKELPAEVGALFEPAIGTMRYFMPRAIMDVVKRAETALVTGLGPTGLLYVRECRLLGIRNVFASDRHPKRQQLAAEFGATEVFSPADDPFRVLAERGIQVDLAVDTTGKDIADDLFRVLKAGGALIPFGVGFDWNTRRADLDSRQIVLSSAQVPEARDAAPTVMDWVTSGQLRLDRMITKRIELTEIPAAFEAIRRREEIKVVVMMK